MGKQGLYKMTLLSSQMHLKTEVYMFFCGCIQYTGHTNIEYDHFEQSVIVMPLILVLVTRMLIF